MSLCWRCENRALWNEVQYGPRYECTNYNISVSTCYCYSPVKPVILKRLRGDNRPQFASWLISARSEFKGVCDDLELQVIDYKRKGRALIWVKPS